MQKAWLQSHIALTGFLGKALGPDYEIALYDLSVTPPVIVAIANGHVTQRTLGSMLPPRLGQWLDGTLEESKEDEWIQVADMTATGKLLRTSSRVIADEARRRVGLLVISFDDSRYRDLSERILRLRHPDSYVDSHFVSQALEYAHAAGDALAAPSPSRQGLAIDILSRARAELSEPPGKLRPRERLAWVKALDAQGFFGIKGAVSLLAGELNCSPATVYRYIGILRASGSSRRADP